QEQEPIIQQRIQQAVDEVKTKSSEDKQKVLMDASRQLREALKEANAQSNSKENCWNCGRKATETCSGCSKARYCGTYCQHKDWDRH
ncbi:PREDICTED: protein CBFA2T3-like, partial [Amphimedon queenslandica]|uniref:MYND-type domain-containing protein n=1 Tax=Amphimedon queenslandica TaxID=400682 RepID=A0AAN0IUL6_AMPQE